VSLCGVSGNLAYDDLHATASAATLSAAGKLNAMVEQQVAKRSAGRGFKSISGG